MSHHGKRWSLRSMPMPEPDYEARCACGNEWRVRLEYDNDAMATCLACGADAFDLIDIGEVHAAGYDVQR